ncbi:MAG: hypothetical protein K6E54_10400 [Bacteroidaceae bacterium]|nr:hypothetical protein [Bacteroidaceae bacterium]
MRQFVLFLFLILICACESKNNKDDEGKKTLIVYYSQTGATEKVAKEFQHRLGADIVSIDVVEPYAGDFQQTIERCRKEREMNVLPELKDVDIHWNEYDTLFIGYPIWFGDAASPMQAFVKKYGDSLRTDMCIIPFCTFGSGGLGSGIHSLVSINDNLAPTIAFGIRTVRIDSAACDEIDYFLKSHGIIDGDYEVYPDYSPQYTVNGAESEIFSQACDGYPMLHATPISVGIRKTSKGTDYNFIAKDDDSPENAKIQVIISVHDGSKPEFTEVIR